MLGNKSKSKSISGCPICGASLDFTIYSRENHTDVIINEQETYTNLIRKALIGYWRWIAEGKPEDHYYDAYHDEIKYLGNELYFFRIQIFDSPEGDTWIRGKFRLSGLSIIEILEKQEEHI